MNTPNSRDGLPLPTQTPPQKPNSGGPAFPVMDDSDGGIHRHPGMSLRDWLAGRATEYDIQHWLKLADRNCLDLTREQARYQFADAMLIARQP